MSKLNNLLELAKLLDDGKEEVKQEKKDQSFFVHNEKYFIRTVTMHVTGRLIDLNDKELLLSDAAWIADSGRFHDALKTGEFCEVEPFVNNVIVNRDAIIDATMIDFPLPREQK